MLAAVVTVGVMAACGSDNTTAPRTLATITVTPNPITLAPGAAQQFSAVGKDGAGNVVAINPTWSVTSGGGSIDANGMLTAGSTNGQFTVTASNGSVSGSSTVTISSAPPNVVGVWTLQTIDGKAPPDTVVHTSTVTVEFLDGTLTLNQDLTYQLRFDSRTTTPDSTSSDTSGSTGTYTQNGTSLTIHNPANNGNVVATVTPPTLTFVDNGFTFVFIKSNP